MIFSLMSISFQVSALEICGDIKQGEIVLIKSDKASSIDWFGKKYEIAETSLAAIPRDTAEYVKMSISSDTSDAKTYKLQIAPTKWDIQYINKVKKHYVAPDKKHQKEIIREQKEVREALQIISENNFWRDGFILPVEGKISGRFGNQRVFNGVPKNPHNGADIAAPAGTPVKAAGSGVVVLSGKDYFYTGNMVIVDHGQGLQTIYAHLQAAAVKAGDSVQKGDAIGYVGQSGRATGAHLHWGAVWRNIRFDPYSLLNIDNKKCHIIDKE